MNAMIRARRSASRLPRKKTSAPKKISPCTRAGVTRVASVESTVPMFSISASEVSGPERKVAAVTFSHSYRSR
ncbi:hypothetical protein D3C80_1968300 [compost metagenome]